MIVGCDVGRRWLLVTVVLCCWAFFFTEGLSAQLEFGKVFPVVKELSGNEDLVDVFTSESWILIFDDSEARLCFGVSKKNCEGLSICLQFVQFCFVTRRPMLWAWSLETCLKSLFGMNRLEACCTWETRFSIDLVVGRGVLSCLPKKKSRDHPYFCYSCKFFSPRRRCLDQDS